MKSSIGINMPRIIDLKDIDFLRFTPSDANETLIGILEFGTKNVTISRADFFAFKVPNSEMASQYEERIKKLFEDIALEHSPKKLDVTFRFVTH